MPKVTWQKPKHQALSVLLFGTITPLVPFRCNRQEMPLLRRVRLKKTIIANAGGFDAKDERLAGNPNQMNIQSMYADIDLDANGMETEFQAAFQELLWFLQQDFYNRGMGDFSHDTVDIVFNRDILINESAAIADCVKSVGLLSTETIVEQHPWTKDAEKELERLRAENAQADSYAGAFQQGGENA